MHTNTATPCKHFFFKGPWIQSFVLGWGIFPSHPNQPSPTSSKRSLDGRVESNKNKKSLDLSTCLWYICACYPYCLISPARDWYIGSNQVVYPRVLVLAAVTTDGEEVQNGDSERSLYWVIKKTCCKFEVAAQCSSVCSLLIEYAVTRLDMMYRYTNYAIIKRTQSKSWSLHFMFNCCFDIIHPLWPSIHPVRVLQLFFLAFQASGCRLILYGCGWKKKNTNQEIKVLINWCTYFSVEWWKAKKYSWTEPASNSDCWIL